MADILTDLIRYGIVRHAIKKQQREYDAQLNSIQKEIDATKKKLDALKKYIYVPASKMTLEQIIEDFRNWGYEIISQPGRYIVRFNMFNQFIGTAEELRSYYETSFASIKIPEPEMQA